MLTQGTPLPAPAEHGRQLFFGAANCAICHSGPLLSDQNFHALGLPAFGPGRTRRLDPKPRDVGRIGESDDIKDAYQFKTPRLRNVALTAPYGHNGSYPTLEDIVRHHLNPNAIRTAWQPKMAALPPVLWLEKIDFIIRTDRLEMERQAAKIDIEPVHLTEHQIKDVIIFLESLTGESARQGRLGRPSTVPSGLSVD